MQREELAKIAGETIEITRAGSYIYEERKIDLGQGDYSEVEVFSPDRIKKIRESLTTEKEGARVCKYIVENMDSFEAVKVHTAPNDRVLVMNFANVHHVGGGFLQGYSAQEESLCRCSTLYASISGEKAKEMYRYNSEHPSAFDSDYMLISPKVAVFRGADMMLLKTPFETAVVTIGAPNLNSSAAKIFLNSLLKLAELSGSSKEEGLKQIKETLDLVMKDKIRKMFDVARYMGYDTLVLGAWGCGAFGHKAEMVSQEFWDVLKEEGYEACFKKIVFAIYDKSQELHKLQVFKSAFER